MLAFEKSWCFGYAFVVVTCGGAGLSLYPNNTLVAGGDDV
jgi:hypothetical protein